LTSFSLDWTFSSSADGFGYLLDLYLWGATGTPSLSIVGDGMYRWADRDYAFTPTDGGVYVKDGSKASAEDIKKQLNDAGAEVEVK
jgi:hypothetical protein